MPTAVDSDGQGTGNAILQRCVARDASGNVWVCWVEDDGAASIIRLSKFNSGGTLISGPHDIVKSSGGIIENQTRYGNVSIGINPSESPGRLHIFMQDIAGANNTRYSKLTDLAAPETAANWKNGAENTQGAEAVESGVGQFGIAVAPSGAVYAAFGIGGTGCRVYKHTGSGGSWSNTLVTTDANGMADIDRDDDGRLHVIMRAASPFQDKYIKSTNPDDITAWGTLTQVLGTGNIMDYPSVRARGGKVLVVGRDRSSTQVKYNLSNDNGSTWTQGTGGTNVAATDNVNWVGSGSPITRDGAGNWYLFQQHSTDQDYKVFKYVSSWDAGTLVYAQGSAYQFATNIEKAVPTTATVAWVLYRDMDASPDVLYLDSVAVSAAAGAGSTTAKNALVRNVTVKNV